MRRTSALALLLFSLIIALMLSACSSPGNASPASTKTADAEIQQVTVSPTLTAIFPTAEPTSTSTLFPTEVPPTPTSPPPPEAVKGTLSLTSQIGYGKGWPFFRKEIQLSQDEKTLIVTTSAGVFTFSADDLSPLHAINEPLGPYRSYRNVRISRDGTRAVAVSLPVTGGLDIRIWDVSSGELIDKFTLQDDATSGFGFVKEIAISPDNTQAALLDDHGVILAVDLGSGEVKAKVEDYANNTANPLWMDFNTDGKQVCYIFEDIAAGIQSACLSSQTWQQSAIHDTLMQYFPWKTGVASPRFSSSGYDFGYFTYNGSPTVAAVDYSTLAQRFKIRGLNPISALSFSVDGSKVAMGGANPTKLEVWKVDSLDSPKETFSSPARLWAVAVTSAGDQAYGIDEVGRLHKWASGKKDPVISTDGFWPIATGLEYAADGQTVLLFSDNASTKDNQVYVFDASNGILKDIAPNPYVLKDMKDIYPYSMAISPDKSQMAVVYSPFDDKAIRLFDFKTGRLIKKIPSKTGYDTIDFLPDGKSLIGFGLPDHPVEVVNLATGKVTQKFPVVQEFNDGVAQMRLSGDKSTVILSGWNGNLKAYDSGTFNLVNALDDSVSAVSYAISNDGQWAAVLTDDGKLMIWDIPTNSIFPVYQLEGYSSFYTSNSLPVLAFSPDKQRLALGTPDGIIRFFKIAQ